jgi:hypothetical protein
MTGKPTATAQNPCSSHDNLERGKGHIELAKKFLGLKNRAIASFVDGAGFQSS